MVTVNVSNLPAALAGKEVFVTQFVVDETHSNPYSAWVSQGKPTQPTEAQWQAMKAHQHLELLAAGQQGDPHHHVHDDVHDQPAGGDAAASSA